jgi:hypothetical protein
MVHDPTVHLVSPLGAVRRPEWLQALEAARRAPSTKNGEDGARRMLSLALGSVPERAVALGVAEDLCSAEVAAAAGAGVDVTARGNGRAWLARAAAQHESFLSTQVRQRLSRALIAMLPCCICHLEAVSADRRK